MTVLRCISPIDGSLYAERPALDTIAAQKVISEARTAQRAWANMPLDERIAKVMHGVEALGAMNAAITIELAHMMGRPVRYGGEFGGVKERADYMASIAETSLAPTVVEASASFERRLVREPMGIVLVIAPWNYPYLTTMNIVVPALIAGNAVLIKHAEQTLLAGERIASAFHQAGLPKALIGNVFLTHDTAETLLGDGLFDYVSFTGSVAGGRQVERAAAGTFTTMSFELGGKDAGYVMDDADVDAAIAGLMDGAIFNSGQCCCGIERIYVAAKHYDAFVEGAVAFARDQRLGNPLDPDTTLGPMAHERFARTVRGHVDEALAMGATAHVPTSNADDGGAYVSPQVLTGVTHEMTVMREETFGPVVGIMKVSGDDEAIRLINDSHYGLTASLWTRDAERAAALGAQIETGIIFMNRCDYVDPALCWTGCKDTGRGGALSEIGFHAVTRPKSYHLKKA